MPNWSEPVWLVPAIIVVSAVGTPVVAWWERRHPSVPADVAELRKWRRLSTEEQEAADAQALAEGAVADGFDAACQGLEEQRARDAVLRASEINTLYRL